MHSKKRSILVSLLMLTSLIIKNTNASENYWATDGDSSNGFEIFSVNSTNGSRTSYGSFQISDPNTFNDPNDFYGSPNEMLIEAKTGDLFINLQPFGQDNWYHFDSSSKTLSRKDPDVWSDSYDKFVNKNTFFEDSSGNVKLQLGETKIIEKKSNGELHIGENSWITKEENGRQKVWAKDAAGNSIPIDYINGTKLLIDGVEVQAGNNAQITTNKNNISTNTTNIKNLGEGVAGSTALTAALSALPQTSKESKLSCGVGTGAYSSRYAVGFGCASKVNERVDINAGGSYVFGGSKSYGGGTLDSGVVKAGFVFKLGKLNKSVQISMKKNQKLINEITDLKSENKKLNKKITKFETEKSELLVRLERLEKIALSETNSRDLATIKLP